MDGYSNAPWFPSIVDGLARWREISPRKTAYTFLNEKGEKGREVTFLELYNQVAAYAQVLRDHNVGGERVLIVLPSGIDYIIAFLACLANGAIAVPLYPPSGKRDWNRLRTVFVDCQPKVVVFNHSVGGRCRNELSGLSRTHDYRCLYIDDMAWPATAPAPGATVDPERVAFLQYTSGSTGDPKGVMITHENIMHNEHQLALAMHNDASSVIVSWLPFYHDMGMIGNVLQSLAIGARGVLMSPQTFLRNPLVWLRAISTYRGTTAGAPNFAYELCVDKIKEQTQVAALDLSSWRVAYNGAEPIKATTLERFCRRFEAAGFRPDAFFPCYGLAESTLYVAGGPLDIGTLPVGGCSASKDDNAARCVGAGEASDAVPSCVSVETPFNDQVVHIVDPDTWTVLPERRVGEIWLKSRSVARGYWGKPRETAATFRGYISDDGEGPFLRTGDLGFFRGGRLYVAGRIKEMVIINGVNHYPQDIEETVQSLSDNFRVHAGAAFGYDDDKLAIVQAVNRTKCAPALFAEWVARIRQETLRIHGVAPSFVGLVSPGEIPKTSSGKIQRGLLKRRWLANELPLLHAWQGGATACDGRLSSSPPPAYDPPRCDRKAQPDTWSAAAGQKIGWLQEYLKHRVNSFLIDERRTIPPSVVLDFGNQGLLGMQIPTVYGGLGFSTRDFLHVLEVLGSKDMTLALFVGLNNVLGVRPVLESGAPAVKDRYLPLLASGRELAAFALTEPGAGSNPQAIEATARESSEGTYLLNGCKYWSGSAAWCGLMNVFAKTFDRNGRAVGVSAFAVPQTSAGLRQGPEALTMGMRGMIQNTVYLDNLEVAQSHLLGKLGHGMSVAQDAMCYGRLAIAAVCLGATKLCYQTTLRYAARRTIATGRLLDNPHARFVLTETMHAIAGIEALIGAAATRVEGGGGQPVELLAMCKSLATEWLWKTVDRTLQLIGGRGYIESNFIPQLFRDARVFRIFEGPTETLNHFVGSAAIRNGQTIRAYLLALTESAIVAEYYDAVLDQIAGEHVQDDAAAHHWRYLATGEYLDHLFLYAGTCGPGVAIDAREWALERLHEARRELQTAMHRYRRIGPVETLRTFGAELDHRLGRREQHYPLPEVAPDPLLRFDAAAAAVGGGAPAEVAEDTGSGSAPAINDDHTVDTASRFDADESHAFLRTWIARRCRRPVESVALDIEFAALGLGSIDAIELSSELSEQYGIDLDPTILWSYPNIAALAGFVRSELGVRSEPAAL